MKYEVQERDVFKLHKHQISDYVGVIVFCFCIYLSAFIIAFSFCFTSSYVFGESMKPNINNYADYEHNRDIVYINKTASYTYGDVIVIQRQDYQIVKRVIALPGDTINITHSGGDYYVERNGQRLQEDYIRIVPGSSDSNGMYKEYTFFQTYKEDNKDKLQFVNPDNYLNSAIVVGENEVFVLGDNRHNSNDSSSEGCFSMSKVVGKVELLVYSGESVFLRLLDYFYNPF